MTSVSERLDLNEARESKRFARLVVMEPLSSAEHSDDGAACATQIPPYNLVASVLCLPTDPHTLSHWRGAKTTHRSLFYALCTSKHYQQGDHATIDNVLILYWYKETTLWKKFLISNDISSPAWSGNPRVPYIERQQTVTPITARDEAPMQCSIYLQLSFAYEFFMIYIHKRKEALCRHIMN